MKRVCSLLLVGGLLAWIWVVLKRSEKKSIEKLADEIVCRLRGQVRRGMIFTRLIPSLIVRKILKKFT